MKKTTKKRMSKAPLSTKQAKKDTYALGGLTRPGKAMAKKRGGRAARKLDSVMKGLASSRKKTRSK